MDEWITLEVVDPEGKGITELHLSYEEAMRLYDAIIEKHMTEGR